MPRSRIFTGRSAPGVFAGRSAPQRLAHCLTLLTASAAGCYTAELDPSKSAVFVCSRDADCPLGQACGEGVCRDEGEILGPALEITFPSLLHAFSSGETALPLSIEGENLFLTDESSSNTDAGYIEIYLDGALVDAITEGDLERGLDLESLTLPTDAGLHHLVLSARHLDGQAFDNPESQAHVAFWVDDGTEQIGIVDPAPGARFEQDTRSIPIEIAALNFTFVNPGFVSRDETEARLQGFAQLYVDAMVPSCMPDCNVEYQTTIMPDGLARLNRLRSERGITLPDGVGTVKLQIVAQTATFEPYYRGEPPAEGDPPPAPVDLVFDEVPVQSVLRVQE